MFGQRAGQICINTAAGLLFLESLHAAIYTRASGGMADALASGASVLRDVGVQVPLRPQNPNGPSLTAGPVFRAAAYLGLCTFFGREQRDVIHVRQCEGARRRGGRAGGTLA